MVVGPSKERRIVKARNLICYWSVRELGLLMTKVARKLDIAVPTVSVAVRKGSKIASSEGLVLYDHLNIKI